MGLPPRTLESTKLNHGKVSPKSSLSYWPAISRRLSHPMDEWHSAGRGAYSGGAGVLNGAWDYWGSGFLQICQPCGLWNWCQFVKSAYRGVAQRKGLKPTRGKRPRGFTACQNYGLASLASGRLTRLANRWARSSSSRVGCST